MSASDVRNVKHARKQHRCHWCGEMINIGDPYSRWFDYDVALTVKVHPECFDAMKGCCSEWECEVEMDMEFERGSMRRKGDVEDDNES